MIVIWPFLSSIHFSFQIFIDFFYALILDLNDLSQMVVSLEMSTTKIDLIWGGPVCVATGLPPIVIGLTTCTWNSSLSNTKSVGKINIWANIWTSDGAILCSGSSVMLQEATQQRVVLGLITDDSGTTTRFSYKRHLRSFGRSRKNINCRKPIHTCM